TKVNGTTVGDCSDFTRLLRNRKDSKVSITVLRERKEQNLTIVLPELKRSGALQTGRCNEANSEACAELFDFDEDAAIVPEMKTAIVKRIQPEIAGAKKQLEAELLTHKAELKKQMEELQRNLDDQTKQIASEIHRLTNDS